MIITRKAYSTHIYSSAAGEKVFANAFATIKDERESNYLFLSELSDIVVEGETRWELTTEEIEEVKKQILDIYVTYYIEPFKIKTP